MVRFTKELFVMESKSPTTLYLNFVFEFKLRFVDQSMQIKVYIWPASCVFISVILLFALADIYFQSSFLFHLLQHLQAV